MTIAKHRHAVTCTRPSLRVALLLTFGALAGACGGSPSAGPSADQQDQQERPTEPTKKKSPSAPRDAGAAPVGSDSGTSPPPATVPPPAPPPAGGACTVNVPATDSAGSCGGKGAGEFVGTPFQPAGAVPLVVGVPMCPAIHSGETHSFTFVVQPGDCRVIDLFGPDSTVNVTLPGGATYQHTGDDTIPVNAESSSGTVRVTVRGGAAATGYYLLLR